MVGYESETLLFSSAILTFRRNIKAKQTKVITDEKQKFRKVITVCSSDFKSKIKSVMALVMLMLFLYFLCEIIRNLFVTTQNLRKNFFLVILLIL